MGQERQPLLYCIADGFYMAQEMAARCQAAGLRTLLVRGIPRTPREAGYDAVVMALRLQAIPPSEAVQKSLRGLHWLHMRQDAGLMLACSAKASLIRAGNILPVVDAMMAERLLDCTVFFPPLPQKRRTRPGAFVLSDVEPEEKPLRTYADELEALAAEVGRHDSMRLSKESAAEAAEEALRLRIQHFQQQYGSCYLLNDCEEAAQVKKIAGLFDRRNALFVGRPQELALLLPEQSGARSDAGPTETAGRGIVLAGSCAPIVLQQISTFRTMRGPEACYRLLPVRLMSREQKRADIWRWIAASKGDILISSSEAAERVRENRHLGRNRLFGLLEQYMSAIAEQTLGAGFRRVVIAGSETADAVLAVLGWRQFEVLARAAEEIPVLMPLQQPDVRIVFKHGSQGGRDFFWRALRQMGSEKAD